MIAQLAPAAVHVHAATTLRLPPIRWLAIIPVVVMLGGAIVLLAVGSLVRRPLRIGVATAGTVIIAGTAFGLSWWQWADVQSHGASTAIDHAVVLDGFAVLVNVLVTSGVILAALVGDGYLRREGVEGPEYHVLTLISASGAMLMGQANDLVVIFLGLEILSIALYVLAAYNHRRSASGEAALKYFILGSFSSAIFVYGIALTYGATGSTNLTQIADFFAHNVVLTDGVLLAGMALLLVGFAFKVAAVPFHMWTPDVYQGSPSPVTGFMAAIAKAGGFAAMIRVFISTFGYLRADWRPVIYALAVLSLVLGAFLGLVQRDVKRMLAYSSINHAGFVLMGLEAATVRGVSASMYYLFTYTFMVIGSFAVVTVLGRRGDSAHDVARYRGLSGRQPWLALAFAVLLLAQAGAPFTTGFLAKLQVVAASVGAGEVPLAVIAMVTAAIAAFFYLRVAVLMYTPLRPAGAAPGIEATLVEIGTGHFNPEAPEDANGHGNGSVPDDGTAPETPLWAGADRNLATVAKINSEILIDDESITAEPSARPGAVVVVAPAEVSVVGAGAPSPDEPPVARPAPSGTAPAPVRTPVDEGVVVPVPLLTTLAITVCVAVTVVFGVIPAPVIDFAQRALLIFYPH
ncbi:MAG TPA: NADH-quinone oxidoreductase subunit N [Acidimicrobiales bacterium]|nr:NADH-quinone oxidoreductase subunit N [Acidimicrobiales bacterium]